MSDSQARSGKVPWWWPVLSFVLGVVGARFGIPMPPPPPPIVIDAPPTSPPPAAPAPRP